MFNKPERNETSNNKNQQNKTSGNSSKQILENKPQSSRDANSSKKAQQLQNNVVQNRAVKKPSSNKTLIHCFRHLFWLFHLCMINPGGLSHCLLEPTNKQWGSPQGFIMHKWNNQNNWLNIHNKYTPKTEQCAKIRTEKKNNMHQQCCKIYQNMQQQYAEPEMQWQNQKNHYMQEHRNAVIEIMQEFKQSASIKTKIEREEHTNLLRSSIQWWPTSPGERSSNIKRKNSYQDYKRETFTLDFHSWCFSLSLFFSLFSLAVFKQSLYWLLFLLTAAA